MYITLKHNIDYLFFSKMKIKTYKIKNKKIKNKK